MVSVGLDQQIVFYDIVNKKCVAYISAIADKANATILLCSKARGPVRCMNLLSPTTTTELLLFNI